MDIIRSLFSSSKKSSPSRAQQKRSRKTALKHMTQPDSDAAAHRRDEDNCSCDSLDTDSSSSGAGEDCCSRTSDSGVAVMTGTTQLLPSAHHEVALAMQEDEDEETTLPYACTRSYRDLPVVPSHEASLHSPVASSSSSRGLGGMVAFADELRQQQASDPSLSLSSPHAATKARVAAINAPGTEQQQQQPDEEDDKDGTSTVTDSDADEQDFDADMSEPQDEHALPVYPDLDRFKLVKKMGEGAFSSVYHAVDSITKKDVAVKVIRKRDLTPSQRQNILKELSIHGRLSHPHIVKLIQHFETREFYYLILELVEGGEIFHKIVQLTYFSEPLARHVAIQVAEGIKYLHDVVGVVHRDIKPENLLFTPIPFDDTHFVNGRTAGEEKMDEGPFQDGVGGGGIGFIKIADFGLSKVVWTDGTKTPCGTVGYTAPEIVLSQSYTTSVDVWALGCVLYTMLCGFPPFYDEDTEMLTAKVAHGEWSFLSPWWDHISPSAKDLVSRLLAADPEQRYSIDDFFNHPWVQNKEFVPTVNPLDNAGAVAESAIPMASEDQPQEQQQQQVPEKAADPYGWGSFTLPPLKTPIADSMPSPMAFTTPMAGASAGGFAYPATPTPSQKQLKHYFDMSYRVFNQMHDTVFPAPSALPPTDSVRRWAEVDNDLYPVDERFAADGQDASATSPPSPSFSNAINKSNPLNGSMTAGTPGAAGLVGILANKSREGRQRAGGIRFAGEVGGTDSTAGGGKAVAGGGGAAAAVEPPVKSPSKMAGNNFELKLGESSIFNKRRSRRVAFEGDEK
ncbi:MAPK-activated protein kinase Srk1 [Sorochytrium milnesiophthora]